MEALTRLVTESLARHGFDRPLDYRRLQWSHWFRCESHHSLLVVPSKPGIFALAEEVMDIGATTEYVGKAASAVQRGGASVALPEAETRESKDAFHRMLAVAKFFEDGDMAFVLDRMLSQRNPMQARLASGRYFLRFVVIDDPAQRRSICAALNQWILSSAEKATGIGSHFATSLELTPEPPNTARAHHSNGNTGTNQKQSEETGASKAPRLNSAVATTIHCSSSFPSGF